MQSDEIIVFRHRGDIHVGRYQSITSSKVKASTGRNRVVEFPMDRVLYATGISIENDQTLDDYRRNIEEGIGEIDLKEVWELLREEVDAYTFQDIAELYWSDTITVVQYGSILLYLSRDCPYFSEQGNAYLPLSDERVKENLTRIERKHATKKEYEAFIQWATQEISSVPDDFSNRQNHWLTRIQQYAMQGEEYEQAKQAKELLQDIKGNTGGDLQRYAFDFMVQKRIWDEDENLDIIRYDIPVTFEDEALQEAENITTVSSGRKDLTHLHIFSIDDAYTMDVDDALSLEILDNGYRIGVHITDVSAIIPTGSHLDQVAYERMTSLYFPDKHIPMLPPELSQGRCSLLQGEQRCAVSFFYDVDHEFNILRDNIVPTVIINHSKLSYQEANDMLETMDHPLADTMRILNEAVDVFYAQRIEQGAIELERTELSIRVNEEKEIAVKSRKGQSRAEHIVSELMILANVMAARYFMEHQVPTIYRTQSDPDLNGVDGAPHDVVRRFLILRRLKPLELSLEPKPHAVLGADVYCQITSPLRRYNDLVLQRQLMSHVRSGTACYTPEELGDRISHHERIRALNKMWSRREWYWFLKYLSGHPKLTLKAIVLDVRERDMLIELQDYGSRITIRQASQVAVGDEIFVRVTLADAWAGILRLTQVAKPEVA